MTDRTAILLLSRFASDEGTSVFSCFYQLMYKYKASVQPIDAERKYLTSTCWLLLYRQGFWLAMSYHLFIFIRFPLYFYGIARKPPLSRSNPNKKRMKDVALNTTLTLLVAWYVCMYAKDFWAYKIHIGVHRSHKNSACACYLFLFFSFMVTVLIPLPAGSCATGLWVSLTTHFLLSFHCSYVNILINTMTKRFSTQFELDEVINHNKFT